MKFNEKKFQAWEKTRQRGLLKYMVVNGGLFFGFPLGIGFALYAHFIQNSAAMWSTQLLLYTLLGAFVAWPVWILNEISRKAYFADQDKKLPNP